MEKGRKGREGVKWTHRQALLRLLHEESVVRVAGRVGLGLEECVEIPEGGFDPLVGRHFLEAHRHEDLAELGSDLYLNEPIKLWVMGWINKINE